MDILKKPEMIVFLTAAVSFSGALAYLYQKIHRQEEELNKLSGHLVSTITKVDQHDRTIPTLVGATKDL